jgi:hypothetical protein
MTTIVTTRAGVVIDALVAALKAVLTDPVQIYDGPVTGAGTTWTQAVFIGFDGNWQSNARGQIAPNAQYNAVLIDQERPYIGNTTVHEQLEIPGCAEAWSGDPTCKTVRDQCLTMRAAVETVIRTDPTLGIDGSTIATVTVGNLDYEFDEGGNINAHIPFTVHVQTTLTTS